jgi:hypothetical protein
MRQVVIALTLLIPCFAHGDVYLSTSGAGTSNAITFTSTAGFPPEIRTASNGQETSTATTGNHPLTINAGLNGTLNLNTISSGPIVMGLNPASNVGIQTASPALPLDVNGAAQFGTGAQKSTFSALGSLTLSSNARL